MINGFFCEHRFLSNFYPSPVEMDGEVYPTVEHAYHAAKLFPEDVGRKKIRESPEPSEAKRLGRKIKFIRPDWEDIKVDVMRDLLVKKFSLPHLKKMLLDTGDNKLVEWNTWGDTFWGMCDGEGKNMLGKLLMEIREELKKS